ncbi:MAG TPA: hypothetical protein VJC05_02390 [Candidatus Andersenbacteria bacterium]|nr:hypothetical protein [Candidatus Andersenbacteria bacterium]
MSKRGVVAFILLGVAAVGGGAFSAWQQGRSDSGETASDAKSEFGQLSPAEVSEESAAQLAASDSDGDGLINSEEGRYGSDPDNQDSDGDGYLDGEEIRAGHDPTKPAPNDLLASGAQTPTLAAQQESAQELASLSAGPVLDGYLKEDASLIVSEDNLTRTYEAAVPVEKRSEAAQTDFARQQLIQTALPRPASGDVPAGQPTSAALISQYLGVADDAGVLADTAQYSRAISDLVLQNDSSGITSMANQFRAYAERLKLTQVPEAAVNVHILLLAYAEAQSINFQQIALRSEDPVKSGVATRQAETMDQAYFPIIWGEFERLRELERALEQQGG